MFKQLLLPLAGVAAFIVIVGLMTQGKLNFGSAVPSPTPKPVVSVAGVKITVEIADTDEKRSKGLSGRDSLHENEGMLFVFGTEGGYSNKDTTPSFWMKAMLIPLDIIWINDGKVVKIDKNVAIKPEDKRYTPGQPIDYVLEVTAGFSDKNILKVGDAAEGDPIKN